MSTILLTGANGFLGKVVAHDLLSRNLPLICAVRNPFDLAGAKIFKIGDMNRKTDWSPALAGVDCIIHAAGRAHILRESEADPLAKFRETNLHATLRLAQQAVEAGVKRFVFVSSIGVNGYRSSQPFQESDVPRPDGPYAQSKLEAEQGLWALSRTSGLEVVVVRPPLVYGPECPGNFLRLLRLVDSGLPLPLAGVANQRSLIGVWNLSDFLIECALHTNAGGNTFLISDGQDISTTELVCRLAAGMQRPARLFRLPAVLVERAARLIGRQKTAARLWGNLQVDAGLARATLDWSAPVPLDVGLARTARWYGEARQPAR
jgi:nucleoside-diphosphate-sugar epimerase